MRSLPSRVAARPYDRQCSGCGRRADRGACSQAAGDTCWRRYDRFVPKSRCVYLSASHCTASRWRGRRRRQAPPGCAASAGRTSDGSFGTHPGQLFGCCYFESIGVGSACCCAQWRGTPQLRVVSLGAVPVFFVRTRERERECVCGCLLVHRSLVAAAVARMFSSVVTSSTSHVRLVVARRRATLPFAVRVYPRRSKVPRVATDPE